jgi:hypothetical protein
MREENLSVYHCFIEALNYLFLAFKMVAKFTCHMILVINSTCHMILVVKSTCLSHGIGREVHLSHDIVREVHLSHDSFNKIMIYTKVLLPHTCMCASASIKQ